MPLDAFPFAPETLLAPMEGVTGPTFRQLLAARGGVGLLCTEFIRISRAPLAPQALAREVVKVPGVPLSVQVMGNEAEKMAEAAAHIAAAGADVVDINLGCPMPRVVRKGVGAAMLRDPALLRDVLGAMRAAVPGLLSAKIRAGFERSDEVLAIADAVVGAGVDFITVHPRRRVDGYEGVADWRIIRLFVGNGDVWYAADVARMRAETGCAAVMIGRPALRNPWIFQQVAELAAGREPFRPRGEDVLGWLETLEGAFVAEHVGARSGPEAEGRARRAAVGRIKELVSWLGRAVDDGGAWMQETLRSPDLDAMLRVSERHLAGFGSERLDLDAEGHLALARSGRAEAA
ncbi:MAG: tRNA-dihydrouridine synthase family protein [Myxococcales bacterium]|nr:tRNA-dihydrouridine synthase family protein [Myxococcales bacterium]